MSKPQFREIDSSVGKTAKFLKRSSFALLLTLAAIVIIAAALIVLLTSCATGPTVQIIDAETAMQIIEDEPNAVILDVRTVQEYNEGHIPEAVLMHYGASEAIVLDTLPNKDVPILIYCRSGRRSAEAAQRLLDLGYQRVYDFGGIIDWPYQIVVPE